MLLLVRLEMHQPLCCNSCKELGEARQESQAASGCWGKIGQES